MRGAQTIRERAAAARPYSLPVSAVALAVLSGKPKRRSATHGVSGDGVTSGSPLGRPLLACGIAASALWVGTDVLAGLLADDYDFISRSISELSASGAPTRSVVLPLNLAYDTLMVAFGAGVWRTAGSRRLVRITAGLVITQALVSVVFVLVPMRVGESFGTTANTVNVAVGATTVLLFLLAMGFGAAAFRGWFRYLSVAILAAYALLTVIGATSGPRAAWGAPDARVGLQERSMVAGYLVWTVALAILLLRQRHASRA